MAKIKPHILTISEIVTHTTDSLNTEIDLDIVCVYNNLNYYQNVFLASLKQQQTPYSVRVIGVDNTNACYSSMTEIYNELLPFLKGTFVLFSHQDIRFNSVNALDHLISEIKSLRSDSIWGIAGALYNSRKTISATKGFVKVDTVDECIFGMHTSLCQTLKFNESICDNWHMYAAEICLHNTLIGGSNYVVNIDATHLSAGKVSKDYIQTLYKVINYYKKHHFQYIWTTCAKVNLTKPYHLYILCWFIKHELLNKIIRPLLNTK